MEKNVWKLLAIIFFILFFVETSFLVWSYVQLTNEQEKNYECLYNFCSDNYDATYSDGICTCYDLDVMGDYVLSKTTYYD